MKIFYTCKKLSIIMLISFLMVLSQKSFGQLIISQYYEGSSNNKFVELTNVGESTIADLSIYQIGYWSKSGSSGNISISDNPSHKLTLEGELPAKTSMIIAHSSYKKDIFTFTRVKIWGSLGFNGNDGVALLDATGAIIDMGPNEISAKDCSYWRNTSVTEAQATFAIAEWNKEKYSDVDKAEDGDPKKLEYHLSSGSVISSQKKITSFTIGGKSGVIDENNHTININLLTGTDVTSLSPQINISNKASVVPASGTSQDFTNSVTYTVTAEDDSKQAYVVTVHLVDPPTYSLLINEVDCDQVGSDSREFVELYDGGSGNTSLDGYCLVLFNGSNDQSYLTCDLSGHSTDENGFFVVGSSDVPNVDLSPSKFNLQNGTDAVALYQSAPSAFPNGSSLSSDNLADFIVYTTKGADDEGLKAMLLSGDQVNENLNGNKDNESIYRKTDGEGGGRNTTSFVVGIPTPGQTNTAIGNVPTIELSVSSDIGKEENQTIITVTATASKAVSGDQAINLSVTGEQVTSSDYTLSNSVLQIENNSTTGSITFTVLDDQEGEADEVATLYISSYSGGVFPGTSKSVEITIVDNDGSISVGYGTPLHPTYDKITSSYSANYYSSIENKAGAELKSVLQTIVVNSTTKGQNYGDIWDILKEADENPDNPNQVWLIYLEKGLSKTQQDGQVSSGEVWNREHVWAQSLGGFKDGTSTKGDGKNNYFSTSADDLEHGHADGHHLRAAEKGENSTRNNRSFNNVNGARTYNTNFYEPPASAKGDVARSLLYMEVRYNGIQIIDDYGTTGSKSIGKLSTLLKWHKEDPVDDYEKNRNNVVYEWQNNRNPFIDFPDLVDFIWGDKIGETWSSQNTSNTQIITFEEIADKTYGDADFDLVASSTSGLPVAFEVVSGSATLSGNTVHITGVGEVTIRAKQIGDSRYSAATPVSQTFTVSKGNQVITFNAPADKVFGDIDFDLEASSTSGLLVVFEVLSGPAILSGNTLHITGAGEVQIKALQSGDDNCYAAEPVVRSLMVQKANQLIDFNKIEFVALGAGTVELVAESNSGLTVEFELLQGEGTIENNMLTPLALGEFIVRAFQLGNENYDSAEVRQEFSVGSATGIDDLLKEEIKLYPNPTTDFVNIDFPGNDQKQVQIFNSQGQIIRSLKVNERVKINVQDLEAGMYFISIKKDQQYVTKRLIIINK